MNTDTTLADRFELQVSDYQRKKLIAALDEVFTTAPLLERAAMEYDVTFRVLEPNQKFGDISRAYRSFDDERGYCQGLYDHESKIIVLRELHPHIIAHELAHVCDFDLGEGYQTYSDLEDEIQRAFHDTEAGGGGFISGYSSVMPREFWAELLRAVCGFSRQPPGRPTDLMRLEATEPGLLILAEKFLKRAGIFYAKSTKFGHA